MAKLQRQMRLTERHVHYVQPRSEVDPLPPPPEGMAESTHQDHLDTITTLMAQNPDPGEIWFFAYGSLIWKPACDYVEMREALVHGWHRAFCLGWNTRFRGCEEYPGLMLALDRGGACKGILYRLPAENLQANLVKLLEREMGWKPSAFPPRWVKAKTAHGTIRALTFCIDRQSGRYVNGLCNEAIADVLATAVGTRGSMVQYLFSTTKHLEDMGIHDPHLWALQDLVARRIEAVYEPTP